MTPPSLLLKLSEGKISVTTKNEVPVIMGYGMTGTSFDNYIHSLNTVGRS